MSGRGDLELCFCAIIVSRLCHRAGGGPNFYDGDCGAVIDETRCETGLYKKGTAFMRMWRGNTLVRQGKNHETNCQGSEFFAPTFRVMAMRAVDRRVFPKEWTTIQMLASNSVIAMSGFATKTKALRENDRQAR